MRSDVGLAGSERPPTGSSSVAEPLALKHHNCLSSSIGTYCWLLECVIKVSVVLRPPSG